MASNNFFYKDEDGKLLDRDNDLLDPEESKIFGEILGITDKEELETQKETEDSRGWRIVQAIEDYLIKEERESTLLYSKNLYWKIILDIRKLKEEVK